MPGVFSRSVVEVCVHAVVEFVRRTNDFFGCKQSQVFKISGHELVDPKNVKTVTELLNSATYWLVVSSCLGTTTV